MVPDAVLNFTLPPSIFIIYREGEKQLRHAGIFILLCLCVNLSMNFLV